MRTAPTRVSQDELDLAERIGGRNSYPYERLAEQRAAYVEWEAERDREEALIRADREAGFAAEAQARADAREALRQEAETALKEELRAAFFAGSPSATEAEFTALYPRLREERLILNARRDPVAEEVEALNQATPADLRGTW